jgi:hypothetical protein
MSQDGPSNKSNKMDRITFVASGPNTRSPQVCECVRGHVCARVRTCVGVGVGFCM